MSDTEEAEDSANKILGIRLEPALRERIKALAQAEGRTESGFVRFYLGRLVELEESKATAN